MGQDFIPDAVKQTLLFPIASQSDRLHSELEEDTYHPRRVRQVQTREWGSGASLAC
jgi:hypothetical protein